MNNKLFVLDFDGVICDSTNECLLNSYNSYNTLKKNNKKKIYNLNEISKNLADNFRIIRPYIKGAGEYYKFYDYYYLNTNINENSFINYHNKSLDYKKYLEIFYNERNIFKNFNLEKWIDLNYIFESMIEFLNSLETYYIATLKDKESIMDILNYNKIRFDPKKILDFKKITSKLDALNKIKNYNNLEIDNLIFIDDNAYHLIEPKKEGYNIFLSNWSNLNVQKHIEIAKENDINILNNIFEIYEKSSRHTS